MTAVKTDISARDDAYRTKFAPVGSITATDTQRAVEQVAAFAFGSAPATAEYLVGAANGTLSAERVATDTTTIDVDLGTAGQAKWNVLELPGMAATGLAARTAAATFAARTITGTANEITVGDGNGVAGNPTLSLPTALTFTGKTVTNGTFASPTITGSPTAAGATWSNLGAVTTVDINGGTIDAATIGGATPAAGTFTAAVANSFVPNSSTIPTNGMYLPAGNTLGWAISSAIEMQLTGTALSPGADGGSSLGTTTLGWQNLFANTGFVLNIENSNWVATHTSGILTVGTGDLRVTTAGTNTASVVTVGGSQTLTAKTLTSPTITTSPTAAGATWTNLGTVTTADINGGTLDGTVIGGASAAAGTFTTVVGNSFVPNAATVPTNGMYLPAANTLGWAINSAAELQLTGTALSPAADGGSSLGTTALGWQDLFANTGFVLNIENSNWVATHTSGILTVGTGDLRVTTAGTNTASVVTVGGTQTLTAKTLTTPTINGATLTGVLDAGGATSFEVPNGTAPTVDADGEIALDTSITDFSHGFLKYFSTEECVVIAVPLAEMTSPQNNDVITYDSTADEFQLKPGGSGSGFVLQMLQNTNVANTDLSAVIPNDDTIPTNSEGTEVLSQAITLASSSSRVRVDVMVWGATSGTGGIVAAVFRGSTCIEAAKGPNLGSGDDGRSITFCYIDSPAASGSHTYSVRVGPTAGTLRLNGASSQRRYGGASACTLIVTELAS